jgi:hypothetical protein
LIWLFELLAGLALAVTALSVATSLRTKGLRARYVAYVVLGPMMVSGFALGWSSIALGNATPGESSWGVIGKSTNAFQPNEKWDYTPDGRAIARRAFVVPGVVLAVGLIGCIVAGNIAVRGVGGALLRVGLNLYLLLIVLLAAIWMTARYMHATGFFI